MAEKILNVVMLRGLIREQRHWGGFPKYFKKFFPHVVLHFIDFPGIGTESRRISPYTMNGIMLDMRARWLSLKKDNPGEWGLFSISFGSMVALEWQNSFPDDFRWMSLMNTSSSDLNRPIGRLKLGAIPDLISIALAKNAFIKEKRVLSLSGVLVGELDDLANYWASFAPSAAKMKKLALAQLIAASRFKSPEKLNIPACMFVGMKDRLVDPKCSLNLVKKLGMNCFQHPDAGHDICLVDPKWILENLKTWLNSSFSSI